LAFGKPGYSLINISNVCGFFYGKFFDRGNVKKYKFSVLIERDEDGYLVGTVPSLKSCYTQAKTIEELMPRIREVIELCLQEEEPTAMVFEGIQQIEVAP
jgi:predicted RNase H-like HicB family nuclease